MGVLIKARRRVEMHSDMGSSVAPHPPRMTADLTRLSNVVTGVLTPVSYWVCATGVCMTTQCPVGRTVQRAWSTLWKGYIFSSTSGLLVWKWLTSWNKSAYNHQSAPAKIKPSEHDVFMYFSEVQRWKFNWIMWIKYHILRIPHTVRWSL